MYKRQVDEARGSFVASIAQCDKVSVRRHAVSYTHLDMGEDEDFEYEYEEDADDDFYYEYEDENWDEEEEKK